METSVGPSSPPAAGNNKLALTGLISSVLAMLSYCLSIVVIFLRSLWLPFVFMGGGLILSLVGLITGILGLAQVNKSAGGQTAKGSAIAGIVLGGLGTLAICILPIIILTLLGPVVGNVFSEINDGLNAP